MRAKSSPMGQHPGRERLERLSARTDGEHHHDDVDRRRGEEGRGEHDEGKAREWQVLQPARDARSRPDSADPLSLYPSVHGAGRLRERAHA